MKITLEAVEQPRLISLPLGTIFHFPEEPKAIYIRGYDGFIRIDNNKVSSPILGCTASQFYNCYTEKKVIVLSQVCCET